MYLLNPTPRPNKPCQNRAKSFDLAVLSGLSHFNPMKQHTRLKPMENEPRQ